MASSSSSHQRKEEHNVFSGIEPPGKRRNVSESSRLFDVFINHRGPDVKETLATELYNSLHELGIRAFLDSRDVELGDSTPSAIETAIHSAAVHVAIFSKRYAESPWCLAELVLMLQSQAKIIPVYYDVQPWEHRYIKKGVYAEAFTAYEMKGRYLEKLEEWKKALQTVSFINGEEFNGDWKSIVLKVQKEVQRSNSMLNVAKYPVGLHKRVQDFERRCLDELVHDFEHHSGMREEVKDKTSVVGIFGMGGIGKTTLSKELFNRKRSQYRRACFLFDVREASARRELPSLQQKLLKDLFDEDQLSFRNIEEGKKYIGNCIDKSVYLSLLIVLDDIDHVEQLDALMVMDMLNKDGNSLIIVTTRDVGVLVNAGINMGYNLKGMDKDEARELFCWHAFGQPFPANGYEDLVEAFLNLCGGLPLSLQVLGRHVHGRDINYWRLELNKNSKILPQDILQRLKISFDTLNSGEKEIFMDVACFFINKDKSTALTAWKGLGWNAQQDLQTLIDKCLVEEIGPVLTMHDHLRDFGRKMANELWHRQDIKSLEHHALPGIEPPSQRVLFDVFINHRGPDVKESVARQLRHSLQELGIRVFLDSSDIVLGDFFPSALQTVIRTAAVHIAIFSKRYAESPWCLEELTLMLQSKAKIIPVFYGVHPWELRYLENGAYAAAFTKYKEKGRYLKKLGIWKEALQSASLITVFEFNNSGAASFISGLEFNNSEDIHALCDRIVSTVRRETSLFVAKNPVSPSRSEITEASSVCGVPDEVSEAFLFVTKYPVGLDVLVDDFSKQCGLPEERANIIGIFGTGGCGKTTLAKEVFNRMHSTYDRSCFLFDGRETDVKCELISLQTTLVKDLFLEDVTHVPNFQSTSAGIMYLRKRLQKNRSLRFLVVLDGIDHVDQLDALLPIDGISFSGMALITTRDERVLINAGITERYKMKEMSPDHSRELFCLNAFHRRDPEPGYEDLVEKFLKECGGLPLSLQELGRQLFGITGEFNWETQLDKIRKMLPADVKKRLKASFDSLDSEEKEIFMDIACFFIGQPKVMAIKIWQGSGWSGEHALQTLRQKCLVDVMEEESKEFEYEDGLVIRMHNHLAQLGREEADERMRRPRRLWRSEHLKSWEFKGLEKILIAAQGQSLRCFNTIFDWSIRITYFLKSSDGLDETVLLWLGLDLEDKLLTSIPSWIPLQNLQGLNIRNGGLKRLWQGPLQAPLQLKRLVLYGISSLEELKSIEILDCLEDLVLSGDLLLTATMVMEGTSLSESLRKLTNLKHCVLRHFRLDGELTLSNGGNLTSSERRMSRLEKIEITTVELLSKVSLCGDHCPNLKSLEILRMEDLIEVDLRGVKTLNCLKLGYCTEMKTVSGICDLENLVMLYLLDCPKLEKLPSLAHMSGLERILVDRCRKLHDIEGIEELERVKHLHISTVDGCISDGAVIWNCINRLKSLPAITSVIGRAVDGAESILDPMQIELAATVIDIEKATTAVKIQESLSAIIVCAVVKCCNESLDIEIPFPPSKPSVKSKLSSHLPEGEWVVAIAIAGDKGLTYAPDYIAQSSWISNREHKGPEIKKRYILAVREGQECQPLFKRIMEKLYYTS